MLIIIGILCGFILFSKFDTINDSLDFVSDKKISIIIPSRNEQHNLPIILDSLMNQSLKSDEIICVDDGSTDLTKEIIKDYGATYLYVKNKPNDWMGKTWACQVGALASTGDILIFIDADVKMGKNTIKNLVNKHRQTKGVISVQPFHTVNKFYEHFAMFFNIVGIAGNGVACKYSKQKAGLFGPVILMDRDCFTKIDGYNKVRNSVVEDVALGKVLDQNNIKYTLFTGDIELSFKMYQSFKDLFIGFTKNYSSGASKTPPILLILTFLWVMAVTSVPIMVFESIKIMNYSRLIISLVLYFAIVIQLIQYLKHIGSFKKTYILIYPVFLGVFHFVFLYSIYLKLVLKKVRWKDRDISLKK